MTEKSGELFLRVVSDGKIFKSDCGKLDIKNGDQVLFEKDSSSEVAVVVSVNSIREELEAEKGEVEQVTLIRKLTDKDLQKIEELKVEAKQTLIKCTEKIKAHKLEMNLLDADLSYDGKKLTFYFSSPGRIDFRALVPDLASTFKKLIRLQQVSCRDKAKFFGGIGRCGQKFCCKRFLKNKGAVETITSEMTYEQGIGQMGANRSLGVCGKLMCCLAFEQDFYKDAKRKMPSVGEKIKTKEGTGVVIEQNILKNKVKIEVADKRILEVDC